MSTPSQPKKTKKERKPQSEEEYIRQRDDFATHGPTINTDGWLEDNWDKLDSERKIDRVRMLHACERAYYQRDWKHCLELVEKGEQLLGVEEETLREAEAQLEFKKIRKSAKVERHIVELMNIKQRALQKLQETTEE